MVDSSVPRAEHLCDGGLFHRTGASSSPRDNRRTRPRSAKIEHERMVRARGSCQPRGSEHYERGRWSRRRGGASQDARGRAGSGRMAVQSRTHPRRGGSRRRGDRLLSPGRGPAARGGRPLVAAGRRPTDSAATTRRSCCWNAPRPPRERRQRLRPVDRLARLHGSTRRGQRRSSTCRNSRSTTARGRSPPSRSRSYAATSGRKAEWCLREAMRLEPGLPRFVPGWHRSSRRRTAPEGGARLYWRELTIPAMWTRCSISAICSCGFAGFPKPQRSSAARWNSSPRTSTRTGSLARSR